MPILKLKVRKKDMGEKGYLVNFDDWDEMWMRLAARANIGDLSQESL
jgi:sulfur relay (sulfurtransferase) DsrC/TusE family protein